MTDGELVAAMARLQRLTDDVKDIVDDILRHPNGEALQAELSGDGLGYRYDFAHVAHPHLLHPERWVGGAGRLSFIRKAKETEASE